MSNPHIHTYEKAGVNVSKIRSIQQNIGKMITKSYSFQKIGKVILGFDHYSGLINIGNNVLALHTDGVGTKVLVAQKMRCFDTIGIDCIAMNVNDIICTGAEPFAFVDYIGLKKVNDELVKKIMKGLITGAKAARIAIVGGETSIVSELLADETEDIFDLSGTAVGITQNNRLILGNKIKIGDIILGLESSGLHSNGYTLARKILSKYSLDDIPEFITNPIGEELLIPTRIYVQPIMELIKDRKITIHGLAHITGGSFTKLKRLNNRVRYNLSDLSPPHGIFKQIQKDGIIDLKEMYRTFNMGIGLCIILPKANVDKTISIIEKYNIKVRQIGQVDSKGNGNVIGKVENNKYIFS
ncbi:MAG TPA: phosphoribosylformylglycinamidine cyclo-ligase [Nitrososphaeraceae archaeon]|nr:phosphoribosylformylglycinamidine cyclo-ligase [Nitrososphaeraceae archaeon]